MTFKENIQMKLYSMGESRHIETSIFEIYYSCILLLNGIYMMSFKMPAMSAGSKSPATGVMMG